MPLSRIFQTYAVSLTASDMIQRAGRLLRHRAAVFFKSRGIDLTPEQWRLLLKLAENDRQTQSSLADPVLNDHPNITRLLDGLCQRGLVERTENPDDRRSSFIVLTPSGQDLINTLLPDVLEEKELYFEGLNQEDVTILRRILGTIEQNLLNTR